MEVEKILDVREEEVLEVVDQAPAPVEEVGNDNDDDDRQMSDLMIEHRNRLG